MAGASTSVYEFDSMVRGQRVYKSVWTSFTDWCSKIVSSPGTRLVVKLVSASRYWKTTNVINTL